MTEQQINDLKRILDSAPAVENSAELDKRIISAARENAAAKKNESGLTMSARMPFGIVGAAAMSLALTVAIFLGMGRLIAVDQPQQSLAKIQDLESAPLLIDVENFDVVDKVEGVTKPDSPAIEYPATAALARDRILAEMKLPETRAILHEMEFSAAKDRALAESIVADAMSDIRLMILDGELNNARSRYERLRRTCDVCRLPDTLEALVLNADVVNDSG